jgi:dethiobiotin synthetase
MTKKFFITGTGTDIGKTFITAGLALSAVQNGENTAVIKPVQTGIGEYVPDLCEIRRIVPEIMNLPEDIATPYSFKLPASPHLAAAEESQFIDISVIKDALLKVEQLYTPDTILIEGAGGVLVPLTPEFLMIDLMQELNMPVIVVASAGLGTINHTLMTIEILKSKGIDIAGIIFNKMPADPTVIELDNVKIIEQISGVEVIAVVKQCPALQSERKFLSSYRSQLSLSGIES